MGGPIIWSLGALIALFIWLTGVIAWFVVLLRKKAIAEGERSKARRIGRAILLWGSGVLLVVVTIALFLPADGTAREAPRRTTCLNNLKQIGLALHNYHDVYRCFPPAYVADESGRPMYSWRVLLLPHLEENALFARFDRSQPWDSPHNLALAKDAPPVFRCPSDSPLDPADTSYVMVVGPETISDGPGTHAMTEITDGTSRTIMIVETSKSGINWSEPRDLDLGAMSFKIGERADPGIRSEHPLAVSVLFADGSVRSILEEETSPEAIRALLTIAGGEDVKEEDWGWGSGWRLNSGGASAD